MKFFLDSAKVDEIRYALDMWYVDGVTTNPRHVLASGKPFLQVVGEIAELFAGSSKPISVEINPHNTDPAAMAAEGEALARLSPNFVIKLPATEAGYKAIRLLKEKGVRTNLTLVFSVTQALQAARLGADYVSPFVGWKEANGEEIRRFVQEITQVYGNYGYSTEIIVAAVRNARQIAEAAVAGAHIVTAALDVYKGAFDHPYTAVGLERFGEAWDATPHE